MQMAGRAGRRGKDTKGYVVYYPLPPGKGGILYSEFSSMVMGKPPRAESQLIINPDYVVRNFHRNLSHLDNSLLSFNLKNEVQSNSTTTHDNIDTILKIGDIYNKMNGSSNQFSTQIVIKVDKKTQKILKNQLAQLLNTLSISLEQALHIYHSHLQNSHKNSFIQEQWTSSITSLHNIGIINNNLLTPVGTIASLMCDGYPLTRAFMIHYNMLNNLSMEEIVSWLGLFAWSMKDTDDVVDTYKSSCNRDMITLVDSTVEYCEGIYGKELRNVYYKLGMMNDWLTSKNIAVVVQYTGLAELGNFIKTVLRTVSYLEELRTILLSLENYPVYNKLENFEERISR